MQCVRDFGGGRGGGVLGFFFFFFCVCQHVVLL